MTSSVEEWLVYLSLGSYIANSISAEEDGIFRMRKIEKHDFLQMKIKPKIHYPLLKIYSTLNKPFVLSSLYLILVIKLMKKLNK